MPKIEPPEEESTRPYRLWLTDSENREGTQVRWHYFTHLINAYYAAQKELLWAEIGAAIEVINVNTGKEHWTCKRTATGYRFDPPPKPRGE